jgi:hypothetical protein
MAWRGQSGSDLTGDRTSGKLLEAGIVRWPLVHERHERLDDRVAFPELEASVGVGRSFPQVDHNRLALPSGLPCGASAPAGGRRTRSAAWRWPMPSGVGAMPTTGGGSCVCQLAPALEVAMIVPPLSPSPAAKQLVALGHEMESSDWRYLACPRRTTALHRRWCPVPGRKSLRRPSKPTQTLDRFSELANLVTRPALVERGNPSHVLAIAAIGTAAARPDGGGNGVASPKA